MVAIEAAPYSLFLEGQAGREETRQPEPPIQTDLPRLQDEATLRRAVKALIGSSRVC